ncbi:MAG: hypothetical protein WC132_04360 [Methanomethylophilus sp.]
MVREHEFLVDFQRDRVARGGRIGREQDVCPDNYLLAAVLDAEVGSCGVGRSTCYRRREE